MTLNRALLIALSAVSALCGQNATYTVYPGGPPIISGPGGQKPEVCVTPQIYIVTDIPASGGMIYVGIPGSPATATTLATPCVWVAQSTFTNMPIAAPVKTTGTIAWNGTPTVTSASPTFAVLANNSMSYIDVPVAGAAATSVVSCSFSAALPQWVALIGYYNQVPGFVRCYIQNYSGGPITLGTVNVMTAIAIN